MHFEIIDHLTDPGATGKGSANDDALAFNAHMLAVFDGATGLAERPIFADAPSDAAWLATMAAAHFAEQPADRAVAEMVREVCERARTEVEVLTAIADLPRWAWPNSSFQMARLIGGKLEISGLGDSVVYVVRPDGVTSRHSAVPQSREAETRAARLARQQAGLDADKGPLLRQGTVLDGLRASRSRLNTPDGIYTLGLVPEAGDHVVTEHLAVDDGTHILLATDGFAALSQDYDRYDSAGLVAAALSGGLAALRDELRNVERVDDPDATRFPRFKQSDDATAILGRIVSRGAGS